MFETNMTQVTILIVAILAAYQAYKNNHTHSMNK